MSEKKLEIRYDIHNQDWDLFSIEGDDENFLASQDSVYTAYDCARCWYMGSGMSYLNAREISYPLIEKAFKDKDKREKEYEDKREIGRKIIAEGGKH